VRDVWTTPDPTGVSPITWELALMQSVGLLLLSIHRGLLVAIGINLWVAVAASLILVRVAGTGARRDRVVKGSALVAASLAFFGMITRYGGPILAGDLGAAASAVVWIPQAVRAVRFRSPLGLSWTAITAGLLSSALWLSYAVMVREWRLGVAPVSAAVSLAITGLYTLLLPRSIDVRG
jgi:hypothetical protein